MIVILSRYMPEKQARRCLKELLDEYVCIKLHKAKRIARLMKDAVNGEYSRLCQEIRKEERNAKRGND